MTVPLAPDAAAVIADIAVTPNSVVLQSRSLRPEIDRDTLSVFGDTTWNLDPGIPDRHAATLTIRWSTYPERLRPSVKLYVFALLNVIDDAPRLPFARSPHPEVKTIAADLPFLREFLRWLDERDIARFADVTSDHLDDYRLHVQQLTKTTAWRRRALLAVQRLHAYRDHLPEDCRLPSPQPFGPTTAARLVDDPGPGVINRTPRISADVMEPLLSAALFTVSAIAKDIATVTNRLLTIRGIAQSVASDERRLLAREFYRWPTLIDQIDRLIPAMIDNNLPVPAVRTAEGLVPDAVGFSVAAWVDRDTILNSEVRNRLVDSGLPFKRDWLIVRRFTALNGRWRNRPLDVSELLPVIHHVVTACFLVIAYLSGVRTGEALNLRRGCITRDKRLGLIFMSGEQLKTTPERRKRSPATIPWVVANEVADAVAVLESITPGDLLFPGGKIRSGNWYESASTKPRTPGKINVDLREFIMWFNKEIAPATGHPAIPADPDGDITAPRLRRTLAWHIVHRPNGIISGATQYGHVRTQIMQGYAGLADAGFTGDLDFEALLLRAEQLHDDAERLRNGEHVSGPASDSYRTRLDGRPQFAGTTITSAAQLRRIGTNPALDIHHGALLTCVYRQETAACRDRGDETGPDWARCRLSCGNITYTDRDIIAVQKTVVTLSEQAIDLLLPTPLRTRLKQRCQRLQLAINTHTATNESN
ncbi:integrase [Mycolicibacterium llatzerense]|uniref:integrase n=1 Tax=Mycolicibacterium llatzerense TaxID=280871 RepID=UPI0021B4E7FF|nr:integrase [Mycolicibacterium llatzerense]